jgi:DNA-binding XRE family transcriptional regulator
LVRGLRKDAQKGAAECGCSVAPLVSLATRGPREKQTKRLAEKLLQIRKALGLSQREMAKQLGIEKSYNIVSKYERGKSLPTLGEIVVYSRLVNVHSEVIVDDDLDLDLNL